MDAHAPAPAHCEAASQRPASFSAIDMRMGSTPMKVISDLAWTPGAGRQSSCSRTDAATVQKLLRCSLLFDELEAEVKADMSKKRAREEEERAISKRIALAHPLIEPIAQLAVPARTPSPAPLKVETPPTTAIFRVPMSPKAAAKKAFRKLPAPLAEVKLEALLGEVSPSAAVAIRMGVDCWRRNTLSDEDLLSTIRCHASGSSIAKALKQAAAVVDEPFEVASSDDMAALLKLSAGGIPTA